VGVDDVGGWYCTACWDEWDSELFFATTDHNEPAQHSTSEAYRLDDCDELQLIEMGLRTTEHNEPAQHSTSEAYRLDGCELLSSEIQLIEMGFTQPDVNTALQLASGDAGFAVELLLQQEAARSEEVAREDEAHQETATSNLATEDQKEPSDEGATENESAEDDGLRSDSQQLSQLHGCQMGELMCASCSSAAEGISECEGSGASIIESLSDWDTVSMHDALEAEWDVVSVADTEAWNTANEAAQVEDIDMGAGRDIACQAEGRSWASLLHGPTASASNHTRSQPTGSIAQPCVHHMCQSLNNGLATVHEDTDSSLLPLEEVYYNTKDMAVRAKHFLNARHGGRTQKAPELRLASGKKSKSNRNKGV